MANQNRVAPGDPRASPVIAVEGASSTQFTTDPAVIYSQPSALPVNLNPTSVDPEGGEGVPSVVRAKHYFYLTSIDPDGGIGTPTVGASKIIRPASVTTTPVYQISADRGLIDLVPVIADYHDPSIEISRLLEIHQGRVLQPVSVPDDGGVGTPTMSTTQSVGFFFGWP